MEQRWDPKDDQKSAYTMRGFDKVKRGFQASAISVFTQATLTVIFMYLIVISYSTMGIGGPVLISVLFLIALLTPFFYQALSGQLKKRKQAKGSSNLDSEAPQEG